MKYIITESQYKLISEKVERTWRDKEHAHQYPKLSSKLIPLISNMIKSYSEDDEHKIILRDSDNKILMLFIPYKYLDKVSKNGEIYYSRKLDEMFGDMLPHPLWPIHGKYIIQDVYNSYFPDANIMDVKSVQMV